MDVKLARDLGLRGNAFLETLTNNMPGFIWVSQGLGYVRYVNKRWKEYSGLDDCRTFGFGWTDALHPEDLSKFNKAVARGAEAALNRSESVMRLKRKDGVYRWFVVRVHPFRMHRGYQIGSAIDINEHLEGQDRDREQLRRAAFEDVLTRLPNRRRFRQELNRLIEDESVSKLGLLIIDIEDFKQVNDHHGHSAGDELLRLLAKVLSKGAAPSEFIGRIGGDEFALALPGAASAASVEARSREIVSLFHSALRRNSRARYCQVSAGAAVWEHGDTAVQLFKKAELALHATKTNRSDSVGLFTPELLADVQRTTAEIELAREAVKECWIVPYYQPIVTLSDATIAGFEALLRINHPRRGTLSPAAIASTLDHPRLGKAIGERMIELVAADLEKWSSTTAGRPRVAVNLSASNLTDPNFCGWVLTTLKARNVPANLLTLEITERVFLDDLTVSLTHLLGQLRQLGMGIALDDFGTGYASLTHLQKFPVTEIKIDRSFVMDGLSTNSGSAAIVRSMIMLGRNLGLNLVAEGVESAEQLSLLRSWGCQMAQGFYYSPPLPYADAKRMWSEGFSHSSSGR